MRYILLFLMMGTIRAQTTTKLLNSGPDGEKIVLAVLGDGYTSSEQTKYAADVNALLVNGLFGNDFYKNNKGAFNLYRVDVISPQSGVSTPSVVKNTALGIVYTGNINTCWIDESPQSDAAILSATSSISKIDYTLIIVNEGDYGGCSHGSRLFITSGAGWSVAAHEYGHGIGGLYDEYGGDPTSYSGPFLDEKNCSVVGDAKKVAWHDLIKPGTPVPTTFNPATADPVTTVGLYPGCNYSDLDIYRPVFDCRMKNISHVFCPVCNRAMTAALSPYLMKQQPAPPPGSAVPAPAPEQKYLHMIVRVSRDGSVNVLKAVEISGPIVLRQNLTSHYAYAFDVGPKTVSTESLASNPFIERSYGDPTKGAPHRDIPVDSATITVNVPQFHVTDLAGKKAMLHVYELGNVSAVNTINLDTLQTLRLGNQLKDIVPVQQDSLTNGLKKLLNVQ